MLKSKLHEVRIRKGLSQEQVAHLVGMTQSNYSRKERGTTKIFKREWILLAKKLEVTLEDIYEEELIIVINTDKQSSQKNDFETVDVKIPQILIDYIEMLKAKNKQLEEENKILKSCQ